MRKDPKKTKRSAILPKSNQQADTHCISICSLCSCFLLHLLVTCFCSCIELNERSYWNVTAWSPSWRRSVSQKALKCIIFNSFPMQARHTGSELAFKREAHQTARPVVASRTWNDYRMGCWRESFRWGCSRAHVRWDMELDIGMTHMLVCFEWVWEHLVFQQYRYCWERSFIKNSKVKSLRVKRWCIFYLNQVKLSFFIEHCFSRQVLALR